jgi:diacylglycerol kinase (ATP)
LVVTALVHLAAQALNGTGIPLGIIPAGTGNDAARSLGIDRSDPLAAADVVIAGRQRTLDLADAGGGRVFVTVLAAGFDSLVAERANRLRWPHGQMRYNVAAVAELRVFQPLSYSLELDGVQRDLDAILVAVGNTPSYGGGLRMCEGADPDDGLLDVVLVKPVSKLELVRVYPRLFRGTPHHPPPVRAAPGEQGERRRRRGRRLRRRRAARTAAHERARAARCAAGLLRGTRDLPVR